MALGKKTLIRKKKFSLVLTEQLSELPDRLQLLISVFIFSNFFYEGGASVPQFKYASFFTQQHVPWQVCPEPWDSEWLASWLSAPGLSRDHFQPRLEGDVK